MILLQIPAENKSYATQMKRLTYMYVYTSYFCNLSIRIKPNCQESCQGPDSDLFEVEVVHVNIGDCL